MDGTCVTVELPPDLAAACEEQAAPKAHATSDQQPAGIDPALVGLLVQLGQHLLRAWLSRRGG